VRILTRATEPTPSAPMVTSASRSLERCLIFFQSSSEGRHRRAFRGEREVRLTFGSHRDRPRAGDGASALPHERRRDDLGQGTAFRPAGRSPRAVPRRTSAGGHVGPVKAQVQAGPAGFERSISGIATPSLVPGMPSSLGKVERFCSALAKPAAMGAAGFAAGLRLGTGRLTAAGFAAAGSRRERRGDLSHCRREHGLPAAP
jgi:hypothetical protein